MHARKVVTVMALETTHLELAPTVAAHKSSKLFTCQITPKKSEGKHEMTFRGCAWKSSAHSKRQLGEMRSRLRNEKMVWSETIITINLKCTNATSVGSHFHLVPVTFFANHRKSVGAQEAHQSQNAHGRGNRTLYVACWHQQRVRAYV